MVRLVPFSIENLFYINNRCQEPSLQESGKDQGTFVVGATACSVTGGGQWPEGFDARNVSKTTYKPAGNIECVCERQVCVTTAAKKL